MNYSIQFMLFLLSFENILIIRIECIRIMNGVDITNNNIGSILRSPILVASGVVIPRYRYKINETSDKVVRMTNNILFSVLLNIKRKIVINENPRIRIIPKYETSLIL